MDPFKNGAQTRLSSSASFSAASLLPLGGKITYEKKKEG
jgi:hypothetical protein